MARTNVARLSELGGFRRFDTGLRRQHGASYLGPLSGVLVASAHKAKLTCPPSIAACGTTMSDPRAQLAALRHQVSDQKSHSTKGRSKPNLSYEEILCSATNAPQKPLYISMLVEETARRRG